MTAEQQDEADRQRFRHLTAVLEGKPPPEERKPLSISDFLVMVKTGKTHRLKEWAEKTGVDESGLRLLIDQPGSFLEIRKFGWVKIKE